MRAEFLRGLWDEYFPEQEARRQFEIAVDWDRYAELFEYDAGHDTLEVPETSSASQAGANA
jgi:NitT/TauT family transport system ATP-binding protein